MPHRIALVIFPDFQLLDVAGPIAAFEIASRFRDGHYALTLHAAAPGSVVSSSGVPLAAEALPDGPLDTVMVSGGDGTRHAPNLAPIIHWLKTARIARPTSVCSGAYALAEAGLLDGRRATTHWSRTDDFARRFPQVSLDADRIYIRDGDVWTSGGITAGIDLALALIEEDLGSEVARLTAQALVVHQRRPGGQSQFSALVDIGGRNGRFGGLMDWMREHLDQPLTVDQLAEHTAMSPRNFARAFVAETGVTPAKAVERLRLDAARTAVETSREPLDQIAIQTGFGDPERMRRAFLRAFGQPPQTLRRAARR